jgi:hypothetical protein
LKDRAIEKEGVPVIKPPTIDAQFASSQPTIEPSEGVQETGPERPNRPLPYVNQSEMYLSSGRRKKGPKRRIVDLSIDDSRAVKFSNDITRSPRLQPAIEFVPAEPKLDTSLEQKPALAALDLTTKGFSTALPSIEPIPRLHKVVSSPEVPLVLGDPTTVEETDSPPTSQLQSLNLNGDAYKRKVEALKNEFGSAWLNVLSHDSWDGQRIETPTSTPPFPQIRPDISGLRATSQGIVSGSRTLG